MFYPEDNQLFYLSEQTTPGSGGPSSTRKKRPRRNSQGDGRTRKASTSSSLSTSSLEYDPCKDLENDMETLNFDDLKERDPVASKVEQEECQGNTPELPSKYKYTVPVSVSLSLYE